MELEEAIKHLKYKIKNNLVISRHNSKDYESIETVLEALKNYKRRYEMAMEQNVKDYENSIPKKKIEDKIKQRVTKLDAERDENLDYASDYDFEIQLWEEMKQELLEE